MGFLNTAHRWVLTFIQFATLSTEAFSPFIFKVNIVMCEFDPSILMLAGFFCPFIEMVSSLCQCSLPFGVFLEWMVLLVPFYV